MVMDIVLLDMVMDIWTDAEGSKVFRNADRVSISRYLKRLNPDKVEIHYFKGMEEFSEYYEGNLNYLKLLLPNSELFQLSIEDDLEDAIENLPQGFKDQLMEVY